VNVFGITIHRGSCPERERPFVVYRNGADHETIEDLRLCAEQLRVSYRLTGHQHWDSTGQHGAGCTKCISDRQVLDEIRALLSRPGIRAVMEMQRGAHRR
jgi:hypothetical protein